MTVKWLVVVSFEAIFRLVTPRVFSTEEDILFVKYKWALLSLSFFFSGFSRNCANPAGVWGPHQLATAGRRDGTHEGQWSS